MFSVDPVNVQAFKGGDAGAGGASAYKPKQGVFDQGYLDYLKTLSPQDLARNSRATDPLVKGTSVDYSTYQSVKGALGRDPTSNEWAMYGPMGAQAGQSIAQQKYADDNSPDKLYAKQQEEYAKKAPEHYDTIDQMFQSTLGRAATGEEKDHFGKLLASGQVDKYGVGQFLQALPENVKKQDEQFRSTLNDTLQKQDSQYYNEQVMPGIQSSFANQGRSVDSSGFKNSLALAAQGQNRQREGYLSNLSAAQYGGNQALAQGGYQQTYGAYQGLQDFSRQRAAQAQDASMGRVNDFNNFNTQKQAYDEYLKRYGKRGGGSMATGALSGATSGAATGFAMGGPWGAFAGGVVGGGLGAYAANG